MSSGSKLKKDETAKDSDQLELNDLIGDVGVAQGEVTAKKLDSGIIDSDRQRLTNQKLKERETEREGSENYYKLRNKWSIYICRFIAAMLIYQAVLTLCIGMGWFDFINYQTFLSLAIGENFAQIVGMGVIVAKFLFPKK